MPKPAERPMQAEMERMSKDLERLRDDIKTVGRYDGELSARMTEECDGFLRALAAVMGEFEERLERWA